MNFQAEWEYDPIIILSCELLKVIQGLSKHNRHRQTHYSFKKKNNAVHLSVLKDLKDEPPTKIPYFIFWNRFNPTYKFSLNYF